MHVGETSATEGTHVLDARPEAGVLADVVAARCDDLVLPIALRDRVGCLVRANRAYAAFLGAHGPDDLVGSRVGEFAPPGDDGRRDAAYRDGIPLEGELGFRRRDGRIVWGRVRSERAHGGDSSVVWIEQVVDISELRQERLDRDHRATHDALTGLPNRHVVFEQLGVAAETSEATLLLLDIDRFRVLNDSLGHRAGDDILRQVADRLRAAARPTDLVARVGGDEFAVVVPGRPAVFEVVALANRLLDAVDGSVTVGTLEVFATASAGIATMRDGDTAEDLVRHAEVALYRAKAAGRNRHETFDETTRIEVAARSRFEAELRRAVAADELEVHFQPEVDLVTGAIVGAEALVRWDHPERGLIAADEFIRLAEETGQILEIGERVMSIALAAAAEWNADPWLPDFVVRVNLSTRELEQPLIVERIARTINRVGIDPALVCLEVTETALMVQLDEVVARLERLSRLGVTIAIDDFGTGFSSLRQLRDFPVDVLKVDRSFVDGIAGDDGPIVRSILDLGHRLGLDVVAEGVETEQQRDALVAMGCTRGQGWLFGPAVDAFRFRSQLAEGVLPPSP